MLLHVAVVMAANLTAPTKGIKLCRLRAGSQGIKNLYCQEDPGFDVNALGGPMDTFFKLHNRNSNAAFQV